MKTIQITMNERLLARLDTDPEVREKGRSAFLRKAATEYLRHRERETISAQYKAAYGDVAEVAEELGGWAEEGVWPSD